MNTRSLGGKEGILTPSIKQLTKEALQAELDVHLQSTPQQSNRKNGYMLKPLSRLTIYFRDRLDGIN